MEPSAHSPRTAMRVVRIFAREAIRQPLLLTSVLLGVVGAQAASIVAPIYMRRFFNILAGNDTSPVVIQMLFATVVLIAAAWMARWLFYRLEMWTISTLETRAMQRLGLSSFAYLLGHSHQFFADQFAGTLTRRVHKYMHSFETVFDAIVMNFFPTALFICGAIVVLGIHNIVLGLLLAGWSVVFVALQFYFSRLHRPIRTVRAEEDSRLGGAVADAISNQSAITFFSASVHEQERVRGFLDRWGAAQLKSWFFMEYIWGLQGLLMVCINVALLAGAVHYWQRGELTIGDFVLIQTYLIGAFEMLSSITSQLRRFYDGVADAEEMIEVLEKPHGIADIAGAKPLHLNRGAVAFEAVSFAFQSSDPVVANLDLSIAPGEKLGLVGRSGAGKSTITRLLLRLFDVQEGSILVDGQDIRTVTQESLRAAISYVPQEAVLFHRSLMENIRYGRREASDAEVLEAARQAYCHDFITKLPQGYETLVGERGVKLSGGERQRVAIARAILKNAPILILDEATASLDSESEVKIQEALRELMRGKTVIAIAHRLSTLREMDRIIVLEKGVIAEEGTHGQLIAKSGGIYAELWNHQAGGFIPDEG